MSNKKLLSRILALFLSLCLVLPSPSFALKPVETSEGTQANQLTARLQKNHPDSISASGLEEGKDRAKKIGLVAAAILGIAGIFFGAKAIIDQVRQPAPPPGKAVPQPKVPQPGKGQQDVKGSLASLRQKLGADRQIGLIVWDPGDLLKAELSDFFPRTVRVGIDTVWISGYRFRSLSKDQRQRLLNLASEAGLKYFGLIDGNDDWPQQKAFVANHYRDLTTKLYQLDSGKLRFRFATDIESYTRKGWNGDLTPDMDLTEQTILPPLRDFAKQSKKVQEPVILFQPWWYENGRKTDSGVDLRGLRDIKGTGVAGMTYQKTPERISEFSKVVRRRAQEGNFPYLIGVETIPEREAGTPSFAGRTGKIGPVLVDVYDSMPAEDQSRLGGVFIHTRSPIAAYHILQELEGAQVGQAPPAPEKEGAVSAVVKGVQLKATELTLTLEGVPEGALASLWIENKAGDPGAWYVQPRAHDTFPVRNGTVTLKNPHTDPRRTFSAGRVRVVIVRSNTALESFLKQLNPNDPSYFNEATIRGLIRNNPFVEQTGLTVIELTGTDRAQILRSGLEEKVEIQAVERLDTREDSNARELAAQARGAGASNVVLIPRALLDSTGPEQLTLHLYAHDNVEVAALEILSLSASAPRDKIPQDSEGARTVLKGIPVDQKAVIALDGLYEGILGELLPAGHPVTLLIDPDHWEQNMEYQKALRVLLSQPSEVLRNLVLKLSAGSVRPVIIEGKEYVAIFA